MHPNTTLTDVISMKILNLEVIDISRAAFEFFTVDVGNGYGIAVLVDKLRTDLEVGSINETLALDIERMIVGGYYLFTVYCKMNKLVYLAAQ